MAPPHLVENRHRTQLRRRRQHRHDLGIEELGERIGATSPTNLLPRWWLCSKRYAVSVLIAAFAALTAGPSVCRKVM
jgi:hypothetical protein